MTTPATTEELLELAAMTDPPGLMLNEDGTSGDATLYYVLGCDVTEFARCVIGAAHTAMKLGGRHNGKPILVWDQKRLCYVAYDLRGTADAGNLRRENGKKRLA